ncbi:MAG: ribosome maturation factor RimP [Syntrophomonadaceae bacterium]|nr:ribosome maturation factor RimP [Syntrophomonadaceae bacterium]
MTESIIEKIITLIEDPINSLEVELVDVEYRKENGEQMLRLLIDKESGIDMDICSRVSRAIKGKIDDADIFYDHLEVSSPGLDRIIKTDKDFERFRGYNVKLKTLKSFEGPRKLEGKLSVADAENIIIETKDGPVQVPRSVITVVRLDPEQ